MRNHEHPYWPAKGSRDVKPKDKSPRNIFEAAKRLMNANFDDLHTIIRHDPDMIRDVAAALLYERGVAADKVRPTSHSARDSL